MIRIAPIFLIILFLCCHTPHVDYDDERLKAALILAGKNRLEIEKVIEHYSDKDPLKYRAARYLVENMRYHRSNESITGIDNYIDHFRQTDSLFTVYQNNKPKDSLKREHSARFDSIPASTSTNDTRSDLSIITADYLINHIDRSFHLWETSPFLKELSFDEFKEFVLPYRTTNEPFLACAERGYSLIAGRIMDNSDTDPDKPISRLKDYVYKVRDLNRYAQPPTHLGIWDLFLKKFDFDCHNMTSWCCNLLRYCGVPAVYEYTPQWQNQNNRHFWTVTYDTDGVLKPFTAPDNTILEDFDTYIKYAGKVYRKTYGANYDTPYFLAHEDEFIPKELHSPLLLDQTHRYHLTVELSLPFDVETSNNLCYLAMFNDDGLNPVAWGVIDKYNKVVIYEQVSVNMVFIPVYYDDETLTQFGVPFMLHTNSQPDYFTTNQPPKYKGIEIKNDAIRNRKALPKNLKDLTYVTFAPTEGTKDITVLRKYPDKPRLMKFREQLKGAVLLGSNEEKRNFDTLLVLPSVPVPYMQEFVFENSKAYRYYRFATIDSLPVNIAHMEFIGEYDPEQDSRPVTALPVLSQSQPLTYDDDLYRYVGKPIRTGSDPGKAFDGDFNTFVGSTSIGMEYETPANITRIRFIPRNAGNTIVPGNKYKLFYYDNGWREHSSQTAIYHYLTFNDVPSGTIYWLRNLTEGKEELPFFYVEGEQYFINIDSHKLPSSTWKSIIP